MRMRRRREPVQQCRAPLRARLLKTSQPIRGGHHKGTGLVLGDTKIHG